MRENVFHPARETSEKMRMTTTWRARCRICVGIGGKGSEMCGESLLAARKRKVRGGHMVDAGRRERDGVHGRAEHRWTFHWPDFDVMRRPRACYRARTPQAQMFARYARSAPAGVRISPQRPIRVPLWLQLENSPTFVQLDLLESDTGR